VIWWRSTYSQNIHECVEVAALATGRAVRDSKDPSRPVLRVSAAEWSAFTAGVRAGEFD
jgi:predicted secreted Zn-dependent protease